MRHIAGLIGQRVRRVVSAQTRMAVRSALERRALARIPSSPLDHVDRLSTAIDVDAVLCSKRALRGWNSTASELLEFALPDETGGMTPGECRLLYYLIAALTPRALLEIGTHIGASTVHLAAALRDHVPDGRMVSVDIVDVNGERGPWLTRGGKDSPRGLVERLGMKDRVHFVTRASVDYLRDATETDDLILLDGNHAAPVVYTEVRAALHRLRPGGVIVLHDYCHNLVPVFNGPAISGPFRALERLRAIDGRIDVQTFPDLPWPTKHGSSRTVLALVCRRS